MDHSAEPCATQKKYYVKRRACERQALLQLEQQRDELLSQVTGLQQRREQLQQHSEIVSALCDSLLYVIPGNRQQQQRDPQWEQQQQQQLRAEQEDGVQEAVLQRVVELLEAEGQLLARLQGLPSVPPELLAASSVDSTGQPTIAPAEDPMALFKDMTSRPLAENADSVTALDMTRMYKQVVADLAVPLQLLDASLLQPDACSERIKRAYDRVMHYFASCELLGRAAMLREYSATNAESLEAVDTEALTRHLPNVAAAVSKLHLTPAQQQAIAGLWKVWSALLVPVNKEIAELQQQIQELSCQDSGAVNSSSSSTSEAGGKGAMSAAAAAAVEPEAAVEAPHAAATPNGSVSSSVRLAASVSHRAAFIETQMQLADRLQVVINKKLLVMLTCQGFLVGRFSWIQFARLQVLTWPFPVSLEYACMAVVQQLEASEQQQQQHKQHVQEVPPVVVVREDQQQQQRQKQAVRQKQQQQGAAMA